MKTKPFDGVKMGKTKSRDFTIGKKKLSKKLKNIKMFEDFSMNENESIEFYLDIVDNEDRGEEGFKTYIEGIAKKYNSSVVDINFNGPAGGNPEVTFNSPDEKSAFALVDDVFGPEDDSRDSNRFFVYGKD